MNVADGSSSSYAAGTVGLARYGEDLQVPPGHLEALVLPDGKRIDYRYDALLQLVSVTDNAGRGVRYGYARDDVPGLLASVDDDAGDRASRWRYAEGRAVEWFDPSTGDGVVVEARTPTDRGGALEAHRADGDVDLISWTRDEARPLHPRIERRRIENASRHAELARLPGLVPVGSSTIAPATTANPGPAPGLLATDHTLHMDGRSTSVTAYADRFGVLQDIGAGGRRASDVARELVAEEGRCGAADRGYCLAEARALVDLAARLQDGAARPPPTLRRRQHLSGGPACPLPAYVDCASLSHQREMAMLSSCVYTGGTCSTSHRSVPPQEIGLDPGELSLGSFHAELFEDPGTGRYVLAFRGTDNVGDWLDNGRNAFGLNSEQYARSVELVERVNRQLARHRPGFELEMTGHSLGGGLATMAALAIDRPAIVFNAAAVHPDTARWNRQDLADAGYLVDAVRVDGEPISTGQRLGGALNFLTEQLFGARDHVLVGDAPGQHHDIPQPDEPWLQAFMASTGSGKQVAIHSIAAVIRSLQLLHDAHCTP